MMKKTNPSCRSCMVRDWIAAVAVVLTASACTGGPLQTNDEVTSSTSALSSTSLADNWAPLDVSISGCEAEGFTFDEPLPLRIAQADDGVAVTLDGCELGYSVAAAEATLKDAVTCEKRFAEHNLVLAIQALEGTLRLDSSSNVLTSELAVAISAGTLECKATMTSTYQRVVVPI